MRYTGVTPLTGSKMGHAPQLEAVGQGRNLELDN